MTSRNYARGTIKMDPMVGEGWQRNVAVVVYKTIKPTRETRARKSSLAPRSRCSINFQLVSRPSCARNSSVQPKTLQCFPFKLFYDADPRGESSPRAKRGYYPPRRNRARLFYARFRRPSLSLPLPYPPIASRDFSLLPTPSDENGFPREP